MLYLKNWQKTRTKDWEKNELKRIKFTSFEMKATLKIREITSVRYLVQDQGLFNPLLIITTIITITTILSTLSLLISLNKTAAVQAVMTIAETKRQETLHKLWSDLENKLDTKLIKTQVITIFIIIKK